MGIDQLLLVIRSIGFWFYIQSIFRFTCSRYLLLYFSLFLSFFFHFPVPLFPSVSLYVFFRFLFFSFSPVLDLFFSRFLSPPFLFFFTASFSPFFLSLPPSFRVLVYERPLSFFSGSRFLFSGLSCYFFSVSGSVFIFF